MTKLVIKTKNNTNHNARFVTQLVRACCLHFSVRGRLLVVIKRLPKSSNVRYVGLPMSEVGSFALQFWLGPQYSQRTLIWCIQKTVLEVMHVERADMLPAQKSFENSGLNIPKWVPEKIRLPLVMTDLIEKEPES